MSCSIEVAIRVMALLFNSVKFDMGRPIILEAMVVIRMSLTLFLSNNMPKKQVEQYKIID